MIGEESLLWSSKKEKAAPFPLDVNKENMDSTVAPVFITTERTSFKDEAKNAKWRGKRKNKSGSHINSTEFSQPTLKPSWTCENNPLPYCLSEFQLSFLLLAAKRIITENIVKSNLDTSTSKKRI